MKLFYYIKNFGRNALPTMYFKHYFKKIKLSESKFDRKELEQRLDYYFKLTNKFEIPAEAVAVKDFKRTKGTGYYLDLKEFLHYFTSQTRFSYQFGDDTCINEYPTLFKARPIEGNNSNSVLFKLNKKRHFQWVKDAYSFEEKRDLMVWRGGAYKELRRSFVEKYWNHPMCNVGQTNKLAEDVAWQKDFLSIKEHLKYKFILCLEGNDVATNLKWAMSSNSLCIMTKPKYETWFMEGILKAGVHYIEIKDDFSDLEEKLRFYSDKENLKKAKSILSNAHKHVKRFQNESLEELLCFKVLEKYANLSGQNEALKF